MIQDREKQMLTTENQDQLPSTFAEAIEMTENFALQEMQKEIDSKQLYFHNIEHVQGVRRRANRIFQAIKPYWEKSLDSSTPPDYLDRMELLIDLCAIAHDMVQEFLPLSEPKTPRRRETGVSEIATVERLIEYIKNLNERVRDRDPHSPAIFNDSELQTIREAIEATICLYDPAEALIYQPDLYNSEKNLSIAGRIIALADIGALGIEGIEAYHQEGRTIVLEENPDLVPILQNPNLDSEDEEIREDVRQRLLKRTKFQINFAKGRVSRYEREVQGLPAEAIPVLTKEVFKYINPDTIEQIKLVTPTSDDTTLNQLIEFFNFKHYLQTI